MDYQYCVACTQIRTCICECNQSSFCDNCLGVHLSSYPDYFHFPNPTCENPGPNLKEYLLSLNERMIPNLQKKQKEINEFILSTIFQLNNLKSLAMQEETEMKRILLETFTGKSNQKDIEKFKNFVKNSKLSYSAIEADRIEKNIKEMKKSLIENIKQLEEHFFCYGCGKLSELLMLDCKHKLCSSCFMNIVGNQTKGYYVLNSLEKKDIICTYKDCFSKISDSIQRKYIHDYDKHKDLAEQRLVFTCKKCHIKGKLDVFQTSCHHFCEECTINQIRSKQFTCPECTKAFSPLEVESFYSKKKRCDGCFDSYLWIKDFPERQCDHFIHEDCSRQEPRKCFVNDDCQEFINNPLDFFEGKCEKCSNKIYKNKDFWFIKNCSCKICKDCQLNNSDENCQECIGCHSQFNETSQLCLKEEVEVRNRRVKTCLVCQNLVKNKDHVCIASCGHDFCRSCIKNHVKSCLDDMTMMENINKCMACNEKYLDEELETIIGQESSTRFMFYTLQKQNIALVECPQCKFGFEPGVQRKAKCPGCSHEFCKQCRENFHNEGGCEEAFLQQRIREMEQMDEVSQCPRCRFPYFKDDHCDHVKCMQNNCKVEFCFVCGCLRSPSMEHGNHYHRKECKHYASIEEFLKYNKEKAYKNCSECQRLGFEPNGDQHCQPPKSLRKPRRVDPDEIE